MTRYGPPGNRWVWVFTVPPAMLADAPMFKACSADNFQQAREKAHADGFELFGEPEIEQHPLVWVPDPEKTEGGMYVSEQLARSFGVTSPPGWVQITAVWASRKIIDDGEFV